MIAMMAETGARPKELGNLRWKDLKFTDSSIHVTIVDAKDPTVIKIAFVALRKSIIRDLQKSQATDKPGDWIFRKYLSVNTTRVGNQPISPAIVRHVIKLACAEAGMPLPKGAKAKLFRASSVTNKLANGVAHAAIMKTTWSSGLNSRMFAHYEKLNPVATEKLILAGIGAIEVKPTRDADNSMVKCPCGYENAPRSKFCTDCGTPLNDDAEERRRSMNAEIDADPDFQRKIEIAKLIFNDDGRDSRKLTAIEEIFKSAKA
jgi:Phage integrase family.